VFGISFFWSRTAFLPPCWENGESTEMVACTELLAWFVWRADSQHRILHSHTHKDIGDTGLRVCVFKIVLGSVQKVQENLWQREWKKQYLDDKWQTKITRGTACSNSKVKGPHCPEPWASCSGE
jgi:hypothetical protein